MYDDCELWPPSSLLTICRSLVRLLTFFVCLFWATHWLCCWANRNKNNTQKRLELCCQLPALVCWQHMTCPYLSVGLLVFKQTMCSLIFNIIISVMVLGVVFFFFFFFSFFHIYSYQYMASIFTSLTLYYFFWWFHTQPFPFIVNSS